MVNSYLNILRKYRNVSNVEIKRKYTNKSRA